jgi:3,4-dihydroxy 2-butanone 4-phosphate synthase / GTP cyclohydrolase II
MKLAEWLKATKTRRNAFAERIGVQPSIITDYCENRIWPGRDKMEAIVRETDGKVTANDFLQAAE